jgi:dolichol kinase
MADQSVIGVVFLAFQAAFFSVVLGVVVKRRRHDNPQAWTTSAASIVLVVFVEACLLASIIPMTYSFFLFCWSIACAVFFFSRTGTRHLINKTRGGERFRAKQAGNADDLVIKNEIVRKLFHLSGLLIVIAYYLAAPALVPLLNYYYHFTNPIYARLVIVLLALLCGTILSLYIDTQRVFFGEEYGVRHIHALVREKEIRSPTAQTYLLLSSTAAWIVGMLFRPADGNVAIAIPIAAMVMATLADGMAAILGKARGKHKVARPFGQVKSIEGFAAGFVTALVIAILFLFPFKWGWVLAIVASLVFLAVDWISLPIADNVLNPVVITIVLEAMALLMR